MADLSTLNKVQWAGLDFNTISDELLGRLQIQFAADFNDFALSSMGIMLLDVVAFGLDSLAFYLDRRATDNFLATARTRKSVAKLTRQLGYKMRGAAAASCNVKVLLPEAPVGPGYAFNVPIPKGFKFQGQDDLVFESAEEVVFPAGWPATDELSVPVYQGETLSETFTSTGAANQVFELSKVVEGNYVVSGTVSVKVSGADWVEEDFLAYETTDHYEIGYNDSPVTLRFGDGAAGNIPSSGASITISYVSCRGKAGRVTADTITSEVSPLTVSFTAIPLTINNDGPAVGGDDLEDIEHAKAFAGRVFKTRQVAITQEDYQALSGSFADPLFGRIAVAQAFSARSAAADLALKTYIDTIYYSTVAYVTDVQAAVTALETAFAAMTAALSTTVTGDANILANLTAIAGYTLAANTSTTTGLTAVKAAKSKVGDIGATASSATTLATAVQVLVGGITTGAAPMVTAVTKAAMEEAINSTLAALTTIAANSATASTNADAAVAALNDVATKIGLIGTDLVTSGTELTKAATNRTLLATTVGTDPASLVAGLYQYSNKIQNTVTTEVITDVDGALDGIEDHFSKILSSDCKANVVTVPILSKNAGGFYSAPSLSLTSSLQKYLDARKEVTHTVFVVSGSPYLVRPKITIKFGLKPSFSAPIIIASITAAVDALLRERKFGIALYNSDLVDIVKAIDGVAYTNVTIDGYTRDGTLVVKTDKIVSGNLIILDSEVITKATDNSSSPQIVVEEF